MKSLHRLIPLLTLLLTLALFVSSCSLPSGKTDAKNTAASQTSAGTGVVEPEDTRTLDADKADLEAAGYQVEIESGCVFGMLEPIGDVVNTLIVDVGSEESDKDQYLCVLYFPSSESMQRNLAEFDRFVSYMAGPMPYLDDETCVMIPTGCRFVIAYNGGVDLLPIVTPDVFHEHEFGQAVDVSGEEDPKPVMKRTCTVCGRVELKTEIEAE